MKLYKILGINKAASQDEIKQAFRTKSKDLHPDAGSKDDSAFKELSRAYSILKSPDKRKIYDKTGDETKANTNNDLLGIAIQKVISLIDEIISKEQDPTEIDLIMVAENHIDTFISKSKQNIDKLKSAIEMQKKIRKRFKFKSNPKILMDDVIKNSFDEKIKNCKRQIEDIKFQIKIAKVAKNILKCYLYESDNNFNNSGFYIYGINNSTASSSW